MNFTAAADGGSTSYGSPLLEFQAGKLDWDGKWVTADKAKGLLSLSSDSGVMRLKWKDSTTDAVDHDLIIVKDAYLEKVPESKSGRVYVLRFTSSERKLLFWMQESDESLDEGLVEKFNELIGCTQPTPTAADSQVNQGPQQAPSTSIEGALSLLQPSGEAENVLIPLSGILNSDRLINLLNEHGAVDELRQHLPTGLPSNRDDIVSVFRSPQFVSTMDSITQAIYSDQLPLIFSSLGLPLSGIPAIPEMNMQSLVDALEQSASTNIDAEGDEANLS